MAQAESTFTLTNKVRKDLMWHRNHDPRRYVQERASAILKIADGRTPTGLPGTACYAHAIQIPCIAGSPSSKPKE